MSAHDYTIRKDGEAVAVTITTIQGDGDLADDIASDVRRHDNEDR